MPLPKAPNKPADIHEDYGAPAEPEEVRRPTRAQRPQQAQECAKAHAFKKFKTGKEAQHENRTLYGIKECRMV